MTPLARFRRPVVVVGCGPDQPSPSAGTVSSWLRSWPNISRQPSSCSEARWRIDRFGYDDRVELGPPDCRFAIRGSVDRIDRTVLSDGTEAVAILDYKRSAGSVDRAFKAGRDGEDLQVPLYARAELDGDDDAG